MHFQQPWNLPLHYRDPHKEIETNILKVTGEGIVTTSPDQSIITLGVITENKSLTTAQQENNQKSAQVIQSLLGLGIPNENIQTVDYRIEMVYDYTDSKQTLRGYRVIHMLQITNDEISQTGKIVDTAVQNGANSVTNINFTVKQPQTLYLQALALALKDAEKKAITLTNEMGVALNTTPIKINENSKTSPPIPYQTSFLAKAEADTLLQPGELKITASLSTTYSYST